MKKIFVLLLALSLTISLTACGGDTPDPQPPQEPAKQEDVQTPAPPDPPELSGEWKTEASEDGSCMGMYISDNIMEIYWVLPSEDMTALYWAGSFSAPMTADEPYSWTSNADIDRNGSALLASTDEMKEFTYKDKVISCSVTFSGETQEMKFTMGEWGYEEQAEKTEKAKMEGSGTIGNYDIEIKGAKLSKDYDGNPAIVITYAWTNNSDETTSAMTAVSETAFQDGVSLDTAIIGNDSEYDSGAAMKEVRPGTTIDVQKAFVLTSETSVVELEISEWLTFEDNPPMVTMNFDPGSLR